jgi:Protein of unknown function (DUF1236)
MKMLTASAAALFLFAATGIVSAQDSTSSGSGASNNAGDNSGGNDCTDYKPGTNFTQLAPKCREDMDKWVMGQSGSVAYEGDIVVGSALPDTVTIIDVPRYEDYGYVMLNDRRVLVNRKDRTVVHVYN